MHVLNDLGHDMFRTKPRKNEIRQTTFDGLGELENMEIVITLIIVWFVAMLKSIFIKKHGGFLGMKKNDSHLGKSGER